MDSKPPDWTRARLRDVIDELYSGRSPTCVERPVRGEEWGLLKTTAITWEQGWNERAHKVAPAELWGEESMAVRAGDVLLTKAGPRHRVGVVAYVNEVSDPLLVSGKMVGIRPDSSRVVPRYLADALSIRGPQTFLDARTTGMAESQVNFTHKNLLQTPILVPPLPEQKKIAAILSTVDDAITATRKVIEQTKRVKQGLLQNLMTRGVGHTRFKETEIGEIPEEWEVVSLKDVAEIISGGTPSRSQPEFFGGSIPWVKSGEVNAGNIRSTEEALTEVGLRESSAKLLPAGTTLIAMYGATAGAVGRLLMKGTTNQAVAAAVPKSVDGRYLYYACSYASRRMIALTQGSGQPNLSKGLVEMVRVPLPPPEEQERIGTALDELDSTLEVSGGAVPPLKTLKRGLMQDLLTGRVRVPVD